MLSMALLLVSAAVVAQGATYDVGDSNGWKIPGTSNTSPAYLADWAANKTFVAGDTVVFVYTKGEHSVLTVTAAAFSACTLTSPALTSTSGNDSLVLAPGSNYYVCGVPGHCSLGQKIAINATAAPPGTTAPAPSGAAGNAVTVFQVLAAVTVSVAGALTLW
jgi:hypothetical protein